MANIVGAEIGYASDLSVVEKRCTELKPSIVFADLSDGSFPAAETAAKVRSAAPSARLVGFASHIDLKPLKAAREAGFEQTLSRSEFTAKLAELLKS
ncbi:MAG TPA: hypothetical protein VMA09_11585 [Candidatus Binataceae bacterium]|nr:hypothetical protein [Candidatus Binataceae bacterium]